MQLCTIPGLVVVVRELTEMGPEQTTRFSIIDERGFKVPIACDSQLIGLMKQHVRLRVVMLVCNIEDEEAPATGSCPAIIGQGGLTRTPAVVEQNVVPHPRHASVRQPPRRSPRIAVVENSALESAGTGRPLPCARVAAAAAHPIHAAIEQTKASGGRPTVVAKTATLHASPP